MDRKDLIVHMVYYLPLGGPRTAELTLNTVKGEMLATVVAKVRDGGPISLSPEVPGQGPKYPLYSVLTADGVTELIEHRKMAPVFFITDDPETKRRVGLGP